jgi:hypothetical protein
MVLRGVLLVAVAVTACACATSTTDRGAPSGLYVVGDHTPLIGASADSGGMTEGQFSVVKRIYWFFAGR